MNEPYYSKRNRTLTSLETKLKAAREEIAQTFIDHGLAPPDSRVVAPGFGYSSRPLSSSRVRPSTVPSPSGDSSNPAVRSDDSPFLSSTIPSYAAPLARDSYVSHIKHSYLQRTVTTTSTFLPARIGPP
eukprot:CAMPEP_0175045206 /NCGR_PEP_ID=MMETSP0052_2-20121109/4272_1 /TAXON_ID=51329 ORGANISM="Polytomella parva, Strain SAG 63-3" /NCGR_SAMPLE_ID=MMETSP0052_2 /ASSEMBLY_ACC=CAM_ASM_000194 /LENGTH=128 /DNA_ID=CAMNT_0016308667 /DNA_START=49 /DNA_END=431 /DNA_ORIENTATION=-